MMATFFPWVQLLFLGTLILPAHTEGEESCPLLLNATASSSTLQVTPGTYQANTTYQVTINDSRNGTNVTEYWLQALSPQNDSVGEWEEGQSTNCAAIGTAVLSPNQTTAHWTSPDSNLSSVVIRAYIILEDSSTEFMTKTLSQESTTVPPTTSPNSVSTVQSSSCLVAALQLLLLHLTCKLLS
ncbi:placenta-expressed transcript 1 protein-like [Melanerpes formicivorus]|uniref:placenta-expressed transcript 1 protein-like n=1 Tax=Melanerpes formicivorus TaxID=211600 RepID=UPI00358FBDA4